MVVDPELAQRRADHPRAARGRRRVPGARLLKLPDGIDPAALRRWIEESRATGAHRLARGYQGEVYLYESPAARLIIKVVPGHGPRRWLGRWLLQREFRVYRQLRDFPWAPHCYGMLDNRYLILEFIEGTPRYRAEIHNRDKFFAELREAIDSLHARGVAHGDLQKQDNLLVVDGHPRIIDFGTAIRRRARFAPLNWLVYRFASRLDNNVWVKLKYRGRPAEASEQDRVYYRRSAVERLARRLKDAVGRSRLTQKQKRKGRL